MNWTETKKRLLEINPALELPDEWQYGTNLTGTNLSWADLSEANLSEAIGIVACHFAGFDIFVQAERTKIGCQYLVNEKWLAMTDKQAIKLGAKAEHLEFYRHIIKAGMEMLNSHN